MTRADGPRFEKRFFGDEAKFDPFVLREFMHGTGYKRFRACLNEVIRGQEKVKWNPVCPTTKMSSYLFNKVKKELKTEQGERLRLYCAIGSRLDYFHGIDGFFELDGTIFTLDIKAGKGSRKKGHVDLTILKQEALWKFFDEAAAKISAKLQEQ